MAVMVVDLQSLFNLLAGASLAALGWFFRSQWDAQRELVRDLHAIEINLPVNYVRRDEWSDTMVEIKGLLGKINDKLDRKVDK